MVTDLVVQHHQATEADELLPLAHLVGLSDAGLKEGQDVADVEEELAHQHLVLSHHHLPRVKDLSHTRLHTQTPSLSMHVHIMDMQWSGHY